MEDKNKLVTTKLRRKTLHVIRIVAALTEKTQADIVHDVMVMALLTLQPKMKEHLIEEGLIESDEKTP